MLDQLANGAAITVLNRMLVRETWARDKLAPFSGRTARFELPPLSLTLAVGEGGLFVASESDEPAVTIGASLAALPLALNDPQAAMRDVSLKGDAEFAQALAFVLQNLRPEPEEELSKVFGDAAAQRIVGVLRAAALGWRERAGRMLDNAAHYFVSENPMVVTRAESANFVDQVNRLRDDAARLAKRVERLQPR
ncbi:MAG: ubiquinone biosynthesis accessory factor UbiJ [Burkholderiaceae bacterium]